MTKKEWLQRDWDIQQLRIRMDNLHTGEEMGILIDGFYEREMKIAQDELKRLLSMEES